MGDPITPDDLEKETNKKREENESKEEKKKKGRTYPRIGEIPG